MMTVEHHEATGTLRHDDRLQRTVLAHACRKILIDAT
jgi:hypothetical protein